MRICQACLAQLRQIFSLRLLACGVVFALGQVLGAMGAFQFQEPSAMYFLEISLGSGLTYLTFFVVPAIPFSMSLAEDWDEHAVSYWTVRSGPGAYTFSKLFSAAASGFFTVLLGLLLFLVAVSGLTSDYGVNEDCSSVYVYLFMEGKVFLGWTMLFLHYALSGAIIGMFGMFCTIFFHNPFVALAAPLSAFLLLTRLLNGLIADHNSIFWPYTWITAIHLVDSPYRAFGEKLLVTLILCAFMSLAGVFYMKRRIRRA